MKINDWLLFSLCAALAGGVGPALAGNPATDDLTRLATPTDAELTAARVFDEPLVPLDNQPSAMENQALARALAAYSQRTTNDDCSSLADFAANYPDSRWTASLLLHLGVEYYNYGYFAKALGAWQQAWAQYQTNHYPPAKAQADRALGELVRMHARIGHVTELSDVLEAAKDRDLGGPAVQMVHSAAESLWGMLHKPDYAFGCGPAALDRILLHFAPDKAGDPVLLGCKSGANGTNGFSLTEVAAVSQKLGMNYQMAFRPPGSPLVLPALVHWKINHYAALIEQRGDQILLQDYTFPVSQWVSTRALDEEASGYFLVPPGLLPAGWRAVSDTEGQTIWGRGQTSTRNPKATCKCQDKSAGGSKCSTCTKCGQNSQGMTTYSMHALLTSLTLEDTPVQFQSPLGAQFGFTATYNQSEAGQPATFYYSNLGPLWDCNFLSYITDNPYSQGADVSLYVDGGGTLDFNNFNPATQSYAPEAMSQSVLVLLTNASYELRYPDGSRRRYSQSDGATGSSRRVFLTQTIDPMGNIVQFNYDAQLRITNIVNGIGQAMTLSYTNTAYPYQITSVADPFGRAAQLLYNASGLLIQITDVMGMASQYTYGANQFITALTTPYGTTTFTTGTTNGGSFLTATDPLGGTEALEYSQSLSVPHSLPASEVPHGLSTFNLFIDARDTFYWNKKAFAEGAWDWSKAHIYHWLHESPNGTQSSRILESEKDPLTSRVWFNYPGQSTNFGSPYYLDAAYSGASEQPTAVARVLDDGTTQIYSYLYNAYGNLTNSTDPLGRNFTFVYATNNIDLTATYMTHNGKHELLGSVAYNSQHLPLSFADATGQATTYTYNGRGQLLTITDAKGQTTTLTYDTNGFQTSIQGPLAGSNNVATFTYDAFNRVHSATDSEGYTVTYVYDAFDRPVSISYADGTSEQLVYDRLDLVAYKDRQDRWTTNTYNANRQLISTRDPLGRLSRFEWCACGLLEAIIDPMGRRTTFTYDIQSRLLAKQYPDGSVETQTYESLSGRPHARTDTSGHQTIVEYNIDDTMKRVSFSGSTNATPSVSFTYDPDYNRIATMQDGIGMTVYTYNPITAAPSLGAGLLQSVSGPLPNSTMTYQYDELGRLVSGAINGAGQTVTYDALGRAIMKTNSLGTFHYSYVNATALLSAAALPNGQTNLYSYYDIAGDQRLKQIVNLKPNASLLSSFGYSYNPAGQITQWTNAWDSVPTRVWSLNYDAADQLTGATHSGGPTVTGTNAYAYDDAGNRTLAATSTATNAFSFNNLNQLAGGDSGETNALTYEWDAADRLVAIDQGPHRTEFSYDGLGRRARIVEKENGAVVADNYFLWCGKALCEERDATGGTVIRRFFPQGESLVGTSTTNLFYTRDHLGSIREMVDSAGNLQARYDYDLYGQQTILAENPAASFGFTGHFQHRPSGLYLTLLRAYDPRLGRWLSRDPLGEAAGLNLYAYVGNDPLNQVDPFGDDWSVTDLLPSERSLEKANDFAAGFADTITFGLTGWGRKKIYGPGCDGVNPKSTAHSIGHWAGEAWLAAAPVGVANWAKRANAARALAVAGRAGAATEEVAATAEATSWVAEEGGASWVTEEGGASWLAETEQGAAKAVNFAKTDAEIAEMFARSEAARMAPLQEAAQGALNHFARSQHERWAYAAYARWLAGAGAGCQDRAVLKWMLDFFKYRYGLIPSWP